AADRRGGAGPHRVDPHPDQGVGPVGVAEGDAEPAGARHADELLRGAPMRTRRGKLVLAIAALVLGGVLGARWLGRANAQRDTTVVTLCDNKTTTTTPSGPKTHEEGQAIADALMSQS